MIIQEKGLGGTYGIPDKDIIRMTPISSSRYHLLIEGEDDIWVIEKQGDEWVLLHGGTPAELLNDVEF